MPQLLNSSFCDLMASKAKERAVDHNKELLWNLLLRKTLTFLPNFQSILTRSRAGGLQFDGQTMAIPAGNVVYLLAMCHPLTQGNILQDLVNRMSHVELSISIRRSVVKDKAGFPLPSQMLLLVLIGNGDLLLKWKYDTCN